MEQPIEVSGKTVEEAIEIALRQLGAKRDEVEVEILSRGKPGFLGFGTELARVRLIRSSAIAHDQPLRAPQRMRQAPPMSTQAPAAAAAPAPATVTSPEAIAEARATVGQLIDLMKVSASAAMGVPPAESPSTPVIEIAGTDAGLLIGRSGETLRALQLVVNLVVAQKHPGGGPIIVDVERYRERRADVLRRLAMRIADKVATSGKPFTLEPMPPYERRLIHITLADDTRVTTESLGEGEERKVSILPKQGAPPPPPSPRPTNMGSVNNAPSPYPRPRPVGRPRGPMSPRPPIQGRPMRGGINRPPPRSSEP